MELDVTGLYKSAPVQEPAKGPNVARQRQAESQARARHIARELAEAAEKSSKSVDASRYLENIHNITEFFNRRLRFSINKELNEVVVKVIDGETDKVIKEIPPEVLQRLHVRIREAIGLLIDELV